MDSNNIPSNSPWLLSQQQQDDLRRQQMQQQQQHQRQQQQQWSGQRQQQQQDPRRQDLGGFGGRGDYSSTTGSLQQQGYNSGNGGASGFGYQQQHFAVRGPPSGQPYPSQQQGFNQPPSSPPRNRQPPPGYSGNMTPPQPPGYGGNLPPRQPTGYRGSMASPSGMQLHQQDMRQHQMYGQQYQQRPTPRGASIDINELLPGLSNLNTGSSSQNAPRMREGVTTMEDLERSMMSQQQQQHSSPFLASMPASQQLQRQQQLQQDQQRQRQVQQQQQEQLRQLQQSQLQQQQHLLQQQRLLQQQQQPRSETPPPAEPQPPTEQDQAQLEAEAAERKRIRTARFLWKPVGEMQVTPVQTGPNQYIQVDWSFPACEVSPSSYSRCNDPHEDWIGLFRARTRVDATEGYILSRGVEGKSRLVGNAVQGSMRLRTPRGVGQYNFRYFRGSGEEHVLPLGRSNTVTVEVQGGDMFEALDFVRRNLPDRKKLSNATMQFATLLRQLHNLHRPLIDNSKGGKSKRGNKNKNSNMTPAIQTKKLVQDIRVTITDCIAYVQRRCNDLSAEIDNLIPMLEQKQAVFNIINEKKEKLRAEAEANQEEGSASDTGAPAGMMSEEEFAKWKQAKEELIFAERSISQWSRDRSTISMSLKAVLAAFRECDAIKGSTTEQERMQLTKMLTLYCPVNELFYSSIEELETRYREDFNMVFCHSPKELHDMIDVSKPPVSDRILKVQEEARELLPTLIPGKEVEESRLEFIEELQGVVNSVTVKWGCDGKLVPFGSTVNNFGTASSDLDISLVLLHKGAQWPDALNEEGPSEGDGAPSPAEAVSDLAEALIAHNFEDVDDSRKSARIPILQFKHPPLELECDICVGNRLAIRNTLLLRTYGDIDIRVRQLAYLVKRWSKRRDINNPQKRTLSSYGYILMIFHFLQTVEPPILPSLQLLPPKWDGSESVGMDTSEYLNYPLVLIQSQDGKQHNTYFYGDPQSRLFSSKQSHSVAMGKLKRFASRNTQSLGELLVKFFWEFAFGFDWRRHIIAVRDPGLVSKEAKANEDSWKLHQRIAIEDPFETSYDVAHVVRDKEFKLIRREFIRAYAILTGSFVGDHSETPADGSGIIELLCQQRV